MSHHKRLISRREALWRSGMGMGALGLAGVLRAVGAVQAAEVIGQSSRSPLALKTPHFAARATDKVIREHPYQTVGVAFGVGLLVGVLALRRGRE